MYSPRGKIHVNRGTKPGVHQHEATCYVAALLLQGLKKQTEECIFSNSCKDLPNLGPDGIFRLAASHKSLIVPSFHLPLRKPAKKLA